MRMTYELWDAKSGNLLEEFESEAEAFAAVRGYLETNGPDMIRDLVLGAVPSTGLIGATNLPPILEGEALLARVSSRLPGQVPSSSDPDPAAAGAATLGHGASASPRTPERG